MPNRAARMSYDLTETLDHMFGPGAADRLLLRVDEIVGGGVVYAFGVHGGMVRLGVRRDRDDPEPTWWIVAADGDGELTLDGPVPE